MIADSWKNFNRYAQLAPEAWKAIADFMATVKPDIAKGSYELMGKQLKVNVMDPTTHPAKGVYEIHHQYIDIQTVLTGHELDYCKSLEGAKPQADFNVEDDYQLFETSLGGIEVKLEPGNFVIFFPNEGHTGCIVPEGEEPMTLKKAVFKIDVALLAK